MGDHCVSSAVAGWLLCCGFSPMQRRFKSCSCKVRPTYVTLLNCAMTLNVSVWVNPIWLCLILLMLPYFPYPALRVASFVVDQIMNWSYCIEIEDYIGLWIPQFIVLLIYLRLLLPSLTATEAGLCHKRWHTTEAEAVPFRLLCSPAQISLLHNMRHFKCWVTQHNWSNFTSETIFW